MGHLTDSWMMAALESFKAQQPPFSTRWQSGLCCNQSITLAYPRKIGINSPYHSPDYFRKAAPTDTPSWLELSALQPLLFHPAARVD